MRGSTPLSRQLGAPQKTHTGGHLQTRAPGESSFPGRFQRPTEQKTTCLDTPVLCGQPAWTPGGELTMPASPPTPGWSTRGETRPSPSGERESAQLAQLRDRQRDTSLLQHPGYQNSPSRTGGRDRWVQEQIRFSEVVNLCLHCGLHQEARLQAAREASPKEPPSGLWAPPAPCLPCPHLLDSQNGSLYMLLRARCGERLGDTHRKQTREKAQTGAAAPIS